MKDIRKKESRNCLLFKRKRKKTNHIHSADESGLWFLCPSAFFASHQRLFVRPGLVVMKWQPGSVHNIPSSPVSINQRANSCMTQPLCLCVSRCWLCVYLTQQYVRSGCDCVSYTPRFITVTCMLL